MGRAENKSARRETILAAARSMFLKYGYARTTMSELSAKLGGSKATLWSYFGSKDQLFSAVLEAAVSEWHEEIDRALDISAPFDTCLRRLEIMYRDRVTSADSIQLQRIIIGETASHPELGKIFYEQAFVPLQEKLIAYLNAKMLRGDIPYLHAEHAAQAFVAVLQRRQMLALWGIDVEKI